MVNNYGSQNKYEFQHKLHLVLIYFLFCHKHIKNIYAICIKLTHSQKKSKKTNEFQIKIKFRLFKEKKKNNHVMLYKINIILKIEF